VAEQMANGLNLPRHIVYGLRSPDTAERFFCVAIADMAAPPILTEPASFPF